MNYDLELKELGIMSFDEFVRTVIEGLKNGSLKTSVPMTRFDLAVQYAIAVLHAKGQDTVTYEDVHLAISHYIGNWVYAHDRPIQY